MSLWHTAPDPNPPSVARTYVLVVGTSWYAKLPTRSDAPPRVSSANPFGIAQLDSPATSAFEIATWFKNNYYNPKAPLHKIWLLVSPSDYEQSQSEDLKILAARPEFRATLANAIKDRDDWYKACGSNTGHVAIMYASGHGVSAAGSSVVLLEDFMLDGAEEYFRASFDLTAIWKNMVSPSTAQIQLYFSDACRLDAKAELQGLNSGLGAGGRASGPDHRSAVLINSATPREAANGILGKPTLFGQALLDCLNGMARAKPEPPRESNWHISVYSLVSALQSRLDALGRAQNPPVDQDMQPTPQGKNVTLHVFDEPTVCLTIQVKPLPDVSKTSIDLRNGANQVVKQQLTFTQVPFVVPDLKPASYMLYVNFSPPVQKPFEARGPLIVDAQNPPAACYDLSFP